MFSHGWSHELRKKRPTGERQDPSAGTDSSLTYMKKSSWVPE
jgi:hypothetical protein